MHVIEGWFFGTPITQIKYDNFLEWVSWAFFGKEAIDLSPSERREGYEITAYVESLSGHRFEVGYNDTIKSARLNLDPVFATQRPFFSYFLIFLANMLGHICLYLLGFSKQHAHSIKSQSIFLRKAQNMPHSSSLLHKIWSMVPITLKRALNLVNIERKNSESSLQSEVPFVHSGHNNSYGRLPVVFVHGLGIGFGSYLGIICSFPTDVDVILVEWHHVSMQLQSHVPSIDDTVKSICSVLDAHSHPQACFVAHSLGNNALSWMLKREYAKRYVGSTIMLDPITLLLCDNKVGKKRIN